MDKKAANDEKVADDEKAADDEKEADDENPASTSLLFLCLSPKPGASRTEAFATHHSSMKKARHQPMIILSPGQ